MPLVLDANIAVDWFFASPTKLSQAVLGTLGTDTAVVPSLWRWEVQDVLRRLDAARKLTMTVPNVLAELLQLPILVDRGATGLFGPEYGVSVDHGISVYDAAYLELAMREGIALATNDKRLAAAAKRAGVAFCC